MPPSWGEYEEYRHELEDVAAHLRDHSTEISVRGEDAGQFIYAKSTAGAVEISKDQNGQVFVEFWKADQEPAFLEATYPSYEEAVAEAAAWPSGRSSSAQK